MTEWLDETEQAAWRGILRMHSNLMTAMDLTLRADAGMSMSDYEVLAMLSEAPDAQLRSPDLCFELQWPAERLDEQVRLLEERGLVEREGGEDGGHPCISLTEEGRDAIDAAAPTHVARVRELFFDVLTPEQVKVLGEAAGAVLENVARLSEEPGDA